jgi:hypothetical protein
MKKSKTRTMNMQYSLSTAGTVPGPGGVPPSTAPTFHLQKTDERLAADARAAAAGRP